MRPILWLALLGFCLGCAGKAPPRESIAVAPGVAFPLLAPSEFGKSMALVQEVEVRWGEKLTSYLCQVELDRQRVVLVGLHPLGARAFTLIWQEGQFHFAEALGQRLPFDPRLMLAALQMTLWPQMPKELELTMREIHQGGHRREFWRAENLAIRITYAGAIPWEGRVVFEQLAQGYTLIITTLEVEEFHD